MKKLLILLCTVALLIPVLCFPTSAAEPVTIWKTATAPKIDGVLDDSYQLIADSKKNSSLFEIKNKQKVKDHVQIYACWDKDNLYIFVKAECNDPHIAYMDNDTQHWIFNAHHLMSAICPDDSTKEIYKGENDDKGGWDWSSLYAKNYMYEWTTIFDSKKKEKVISDHFGTLSTKTGFAYETKSEKGYDYYEQQIPMKMLTTSVMANGMKPAVGTVFGLGLSVGFVDVGTDYKEDQQVTTTLSKYFDGKNINALTLCKLDSKLEEPIESSEASSEVSSEVSSTVTSSVTSSEPQTSSTANSSNSGSSAASAVFAPTDSVPDTTEDNGFEYWWQVIAGAAVVIAAVVTVVVIKKRKQA